MRIDLCFVFFFFEKTEARPWWLTFVILAIQEAEFRRMAVQGKLRQIVHETLS
jgi:hypothetical protein